jgi:hypothetical protein
MKNFNQSIKVEVSVDSIAKQLLDNMNPEFKHNELVVETLIGRMLTSDKQGISMLYNSLNGYNQEINFEVGNTVKPTDLNKYSYWDTNAEGERVRSSKNIETAEVVEVNPYRDNKIKIAYVTFDSRGNEVIVTEWVNHTTCDKVGIQEYALSV